MSYVDIKAAARDKALERCIINILSGCDKSNRISRKELARQVFAGRANSVNDRKVRLAIASLQSQGYPILSDSGAGGYWLGNADEIEAYIAELESRRAALAEKIKALRSTSHNSKRPIQPPLL